MSVARLFPHKHENEIYVDEESPAQDHCIYLPHKVSEKKMFL